MPERDRVAAALVGKLNSIGQLRDEDRQALEAAPFSLKAMHADQDLLREGERPLQCCILLDGWACRHRSLKVGQRQILSLQLAGDLIDFQSYALPVMDHTITTLTDATVACISHASLRALLAQSPHLTNLLWRATLIEAAITRQWLLNLGQRDARERIAHLLCELFVRLEAAGFAHTDADNRTFQWPLTQLQISQAVGMSAVHVNRSLQELRAQKLIIAQGRRVTILDWPRLAELSEFDPAYLALAPAVETAA